MSTIQIDRLLDTVVRTGASDLHLTVGRKPTLRLHGGLKNLDTKVLDGDDCVALMKQITPEKAQQELQEEGSCDFGFAFGTQARFRVAIFRQRGDITLCLRLIPNELLTFEQIGLPKILKELIRRPRGLFIVTGPTGSGKTTSLATMIDYVNTNLERHIVTAEDPIEYYHYHKKSIVNQREVGNDVPSFSEALRRVLRADPDVILVGEMRDLETIEAAIQAAETGHLVLSTLHTSSAVKTIDRIIDIFPSGQKSQIRSMLSESLEAVIAQKLLKTKDGKSRIPACEIMIANTAIRNLIREDRIYQIPSIIQSGGVEGMQSLDQDLQRLVSKGEIERKMAQGIAENPKLFAQNVL